MRKQVVQTACGWNIFFLYAPFFAVLYSSPFSWLINVDWPRGEFSYCFFIPLVFLYLVFEKKEVFKRTPSIHTWKGIWLIGLSISLYWLGELGGEFYSLYLSSWLMFIGICWTHWGAKKLKVVAFPLFFLLTMFPPPNFIYNKISVYLQLLASQTGASVLQLFGLSVFREGNIIDLGFTQLQVVESCSGLRFLNPLMILGLLLVYLSRMALWRKIIIIFSVIPVAVFTNSFRIFTVGFLHKYYGKAVADGFFHDFSGWFIFVASLLLLLAEVWTLKRILPEGDSLYYAKQPLKNGNVSLPKINGFVENIRLPQFWLIAALMGGTSIISSGVEFRENIPIAKSFADFPMKIGEWTGGRQDLEQRFLDSLDLSDYILVDYKDSSFKKVNFYVAYYESQRKGESIHSPETCLPGSGWVFKGLGDGKIRIPGINRSVKMNRALIQKGSVRGLSYFWFSQRGRILTNAYQLKLFTFLGALSQQRTDGALIRIITPVYEGESIGDADKRLKRFIYQIEPVLSQFLPL